MEVSEPVNICVCVCVPLHSVTKLGAMWAFVSGLRVRWYA